MNRDEMLTLLPAYEATLAQRFGVTELTLFGSFARDQAGDDRDVKQARSQRQRHLAPAHERLETPTTRLV